VSSLIDTSAIAGPRLPEVDGEWWISVVTVGELQAGVLLAGEVTEQARRLRRLSSTVARASVLTVDNAVAARYAELRAATTRQPSNDLWIAATALAHDLTLITADARLASTPLIRARLIDGSD
jgi:predicted nucleic acid-binding protein